MDKRKSKFSFSKKSDTNKETLEEFKNKLRGDVLQFLNNTPKGDQQIQAFLRRIGVNLDKNEQDYLFDMKEYYNKYIESDILGEGCIGLVKNVIRKSDQKDFACKIVRTDSEEIVKNMIQEFINLRKLKHPHIVVVEEIYIEWTEGFQSTGMVCVIMEKIDGREMFEWYFMKNYLESSARILFTQILESIKYMHDNYCCHRDLKPNNILCLQDGKSIKITDFNVSKFTDSYKEFGNLNEHGKIEMWTYTGTVAFSAPEIFSGGVYNEQVDMWSAGVILFVMLSGELPFSSDYLNDLIDQIRQCQYEMNGQIWNQISESAKDLIQQLLQLNPQQRLTPEQALNHPWITHEQSSSKIPLHQLQKNMAKFLSQKWEKRESKMKQLCYLFGVGELWKRHSLGQESNFSIYEEFNKYKSIDISGLQQTGQVKVTKDTSTKGVYNIDYSFSDSD